MPSRIDLHTHTTASDGTLDPPDLLRKAHELGISYLAISDHDSTTGFESILPLLPSFQPLQLIPAIEINAEGPFACHLLGYFINYQDAVFQKRLSEYRQLRISRVKANWWG